MKSNELLRRANRQPFSHYSLREPFHLRGIWKSQQGTCVAGRDDICGEPALDQRRKFHEAQRVGDL